MNTTLPANPENGIVCVDPALLPGATDTHMTVLVYLGRCIVLRAGHIDPLALRQLLTGTDPISFRDWESRYGWYWVGDALLCEVDWDSLRGSLRKKISREKRVYKACTRLASDGTTLDRMVPSSFYDPAATARKRTANVNEFASILGKLLGFQDRRRRGVGTTCPIRSVNPTGRRYEQYLHCTGHSAFRSSRFPRGRFPTKIYDGLPRWLKVELRALPYAIEVPDDYPL